MRRRQAGRVKYQAAVAKESQKQLAAATKSYHACILAVRCIQVDDRF